MNKSEQVNELASALSKAQGMMRSALKDAENPHFRSNYATLASVWDAIREPLSKNGLSVVQTHYVEPDGKLYMETILLHSSGQFICAVLPVPPGDGTPQKIKASITYMRRAGLEAICGVAPDDDDDGNTAQSANMPTTPRPSPGPTPIKPKADPVQTPNAFANSERVVKARERLDRLNKALVGSTLVGADVNKLMKEKFNKGGLGELSELEFVCLMGLVKPDPTTPQEDDIPY